MADFMLSEQTAIMISQLVLEAYLMSVGSLILSEDEEFGGRINEGEDSKICDDQLQDEKNVETKVVE